MKQGRRVQPRMPEGWESGQDPCPAPVAMSREPCPGSTGVPQASCPAEGDLASFIPHHGPTTCTPHPAPRVPRGAHIPHLVPHTAAAPGALPAALTRTLTCSAHEHSHTGGQQCHALSPRSHAPSVTPLHAQPWRSTPQPHRPWGDTAPRYPRRFWGDTAPDAPHTPSLLG